MFGQEIASPYWITKKFVTSKKNKLEKTQNGLRIINNVKCHNKKILLNKVCLG